MSIYVLVHGSWHGAWCWDKVIPLLAHEGHTAIALDLPGHGDDRTPPLGITLQHYGDAICRVLDAQPEPVILVGHSMAGIAISHAAEQRPRKVKTLVFVTGFLLRDGESLFEVAQQDEDSLIGPNAVVNETEGVFSVGDGAVRETFYGECSDEDVARARQLLRPDPMAPSASPLKLSSANFGRVPRVYIECLRDRAISPAFRGRCTPRRRAEPSSRWTRTIRRSSPRRRSSSGI